MPFRDRGVALGTLFGPSLDQGRCGKGPAITRVRPSKRFVSSRVAPDNVAAPVWFVSLRLSPPPFHRLSPHISNFCLVSLPVTGTFAETPSSSSHPRRLSGNP